MRDYKSRFIREAIRCNALSFGEFTLKSGRISPYFFNAGNFCNGETMSIVGQCYAEAISESGLDFDMLFGPAYKGIPLAASAAIALNDVFQTRIPYCFNRKENKSHGEGGIMAGSPLQGRVLIIDDVQFFSGKSGTQDVFFHVFNHLHQNGKQVIITSDKAPVDMQDIEQRLLSRFKWGLSAELQVPDLETRISILKNKLFRDGVTINENIIEYVAKNIKTNVRELEGAIISLIAQSSFNRVDIDLELAKEIVNKFVKNTKREVSIDYIQKVVSEYFQMDIATLQSKTRKRHIVQARQLAMYFAKKFTKASLASIGSQIGKRDHATVLHACKTVDNLSFTDKQFRKYVEDLNQKLTL